MIYIKLLFVFMLLLPVIVLMWFLINRLINEWSVLIKKNARAATEVDTAEKRQSSYGQKNYSSVAGRDTAGAGYGRYSRERLQYPSYAPKDSFRDIGRREKDEDTPMETIEGTEDKQRKVRKEEKPRSKRKRRKDRRNRKKDRERQ